MKKMQIIFKFRKLTSENVAARSSTSGKDPNVLPCKKELD